jgi:hypothetical protein
MPEYHGICRNIPEYHGINRNITIYFFPDGSHATVYKHASSNIGAVRAGFLWWSVVEGAGLWWRELDCGGGSWIVVE